MKPSKLIASCVAILIVLVLAGCNDDNSSNQLKGSGTLQSETRSVSGFDRVVLRGSGELTIIQSGQESLEVETDDNILDYVETEVRGNTLYLEIDSGDYDSISTTELNYTLEIDNLSRVEITGSGDIIATSLDLDDITFDINGSGDIDVDSLHATTLTVDIAGSGDADIAGELESTEIIVSGSGGIRIGNLQSESADIHFSGSGSATVWATHSLTIDISGSGEVNYYGQPSLTQSISGSGTISSLGEK